MEFTLTIKGTYVNTMKSMLAIAVVLLAGCARQPDAPPPGRVGMANPASVWCLEKGGKRVTQHTAQGESTLCQLPGGEQLDEWALWRRDHPQKP